MGKCFEQLSDERRAIITYNKLNSLYPSETSGFYQIGKLFYKKNDNDIAWENFNKIITINPLNYKSHTYLALIAKIDKLDPSKEAVVLEHLRQAKDEAVHDKKFKVIINQTFAQIYEDKGNIDLAVKYYYILHNLNPDEIDFLLHLANLHLQKKKYVTALNLYLRAFKIDPNHSLVLNQSANLYAYLSKYEEAIFFFELLLNKEPSNIEVILTLGKLYRDKVDDCDLAIQTFSKGIDLQSENLAYYEVL